MFIRYTFSCRATYLCETASEGGKSGFTLRRSGFGAEKSGELYYIRYGLIARVIFANVGCWPALDQPAAAQQWQGIGSFVHGRLRLHENLIW